LPFTFDSCIVVKDSKRRRLPIGSMTAQQLGWLKSFFAGAISEQALTAFAGP